jgi:hypothetical protein
MRIITILLLAIPTMVLAKDPFIPIEAGKIIEKDPRGMKLGFKLLVGKIESTNLYDVVVYSIHPVTGRTNHIVKCKNGHVERNHDGLLAINLENVTVEQQDTNGTISKFTATLYPLRYNTTAIKDSNQASETIDTKAAPQPQR